MPRCPVCRTKYVVGKVDNCSLCGWNLQPYSLVLGLVPEVMLKEQTRLEWAQALWASVKFYREQIQQFQLKLKDTEQTTVQLRSELEQVKRTRDQFQTNLNQRELDLAHLRLLLEQANQTHDQLLATLQQKESNQANLLYQSERVNQELIHLRSELEKVKEAQNHLEAEVPIETVLLVESQVHEEKEEEKEEKIVHIQPEVVPALTINKQTLTIYIVNVDAWGNQIDCYQNQVSYFQEKLENFDLDLELVELPKGEFWMGSQTTEQGREIHEEPQHLVKIEPFYMSRFPITQSQWRVIANLPTINRSLNPDPSNIKGDNQPVEQVSWYDAVEFCERLAHATGKNYRLPSEAEWEYACRAGTSTPFHFGETITSTLANYDGNYTYNLEAPGQYCQRAVAVDSYKIANAFGLVDMHGNVWEWCYDPWHDNYHGATCDGSVWEEGGSQNRRLLRGGAWYCLPCLCRSAQRHWDEANHGGSGISFRVVFSV
ncbi:formylglycine-generating enzyme family protein [Dulcicalothrix desertica]|nr:formylglycine-generating enzyme family protein [Dulcicalothrix desertica]TWH55479.1 formylglycine-generating enzyme required for sulfatase activity [Dulcicalothrix desertica PCC 7102]